MKLHCRTSPNKVAATPKAKNTENDVEQIKEAYRSLYDEKKEVEIKLADLRVIADEDQRHIQRLQKNLTTAREEIESLSLR